jgi:hypothetical protein
MIDVLDPLWPTFMNLSLPDLVLVGEMITNTYKNVKIDGSLRKGWNNTKLERCSS